MQQGDHREEYKRVNTNIWGWKWSWISLIIIAIGFVFLIFVGPKEDANAKSTVTTESAVEVDSTDSE